MEKDTFGVIIDIYTYSWVVLFVQQIHVRTDRGLGIDIPLVFQDSESKVNMVTKEFARMSEWTENPVTQILQSTNHQPEVWNTVA